MGFFYSGIPEFGIPEPPGIFDPPLAPQGFPNYRVRADFFAPPAEDLVLF
jgi:hypothetical protein